MSGEDGGVASDSDAGDGAAPADSFAPGPPHVLFIGRFDRTDPAGPRCAFSGCRIIARFDGTDVSATLKEQYGSWMVAAPGEWDVIVDGQTTQKLVMTATETKYVLASGLQKGPHVVELYRRSEPQTGTTLFLGFDFAGGTLLSPPKRKARRIEVIGDSSSTGFGVEGVGMTDASGKCPGPNHAAKYQNFRKAWPAVLGTVVDGEVYSSSLSGKGIFQNIWVTDKDTLPIMFLQTVPFASTALWDFSQWKPDVAIVMAGGNDFATGQPADEGPATLAEFTDAYRQLVAKLRQEYAQAHLVLTVSPTTDDNEPVGSNTRSNIKTGAQTVVNERNAQGDAKVYFFEPNKAPKSEMTGCEGHGNPQFHERVATEMAGFIKPKLGW